MKRYEPISGKSEQEARALAEELFPKRANLYAVLDFAVCFGIYEEGSFFSGIGDSTEPEPLDWRYLQELRIFDEEKELLLVPWEGSWSGRIRRDVSGKEDGREVKEYEIEERQKLWGRIKSGNEGIPGWSLLVSQRGTCIQIPVELGKWEDEAAICVRRYVRIPNVEKREELVYQNDNRMVKFCPWKGGAENNEEG